MLLYTYYQVQFFGQFVVVNHTHVMGVVWAVVSWKRLLQLIHYQVHFIWPVCGCGPHPLNGGGFVEEEVVVIWSIVEISWDLESKAGCGSLH